MNSEYELLPCPFCGGKAEIYDYEEHVDSPYWKVECEDCYGNMRRQDTKLQAIAEWNMRFEHKRLTKTPKLLEDEFIEF